MCWMSAHGAEISSSPVALVARIPCFVDRLRSSLSFFLCGIENEMSLYELNEPFSQCGVPLVSFSNFLFLDVDASL